MKLVGQQEPAADSPILEEEEEFVYIPRPEIMSLDHIDKKFRNNYYHNLDNLMVDLEHLVNNTIKLRCKNVLSKIYLTNFLINA
jgi:hypothetical protein